MIQKNDVLVGERLVDTDLLDWVSANVRSF
jgi:hypothetical protein